MTFIVDITTKKRNENTWDVFAKCGNDDRVQLGYITYNDKGFNAADPWVPRGLNDAHPITWCSTKREAVRMISAKALEIYNSCECRYGKQTWRWLRVS